MNQFIAIVRTNAGYGVVADYREVRRLVPREIWFFGSGRVLDGNAEAKNVFRALEHQAHVYDVPMHHFDSYVPFRPGEGPRFSMENCEIQEQPSRGGFHEATITGDFFGFFPPHIGVRRAEPQKNEGRVSPWLQILRCLARRARPGVNSTDEFVQGDFVEAVEWLGLSRDFRSFPELMRKMDSVLGKRFVDDRGIEWEFTSRRGKHQKVYILRLIGPANGSLKEAVKEPLGEAAFEGYSIADGSSMDNYQALRKALIEGWRGAFAVVGPTGSGKTRLVEDLLKNCGKKVFCDRAPARKDAMPNYIYMNQNKGYLWFDDVTNKEAENPSLTAFIRSESMEFRIPHTTKLKRIDNHCCVIVDGAGLVETPDFCRRYKIIRLAAPVEAR